MRPEILDRFVCAKYLFLSGIESLDRGGPYAAGLAVLSFQDAVELMLRTIAEHFHAPVKENAPFNQVLDDIEKACNQALTYRTALIQLNHSRVKFKHHGLLPRDEDAKKFRNDLEGFFPQVLNSTVNLHFDELSLTSLVRHRRTSNWLRKAEHAFSADDFQSSITASAVAFAVFQDTQRPEYDGPSLEASMRASEPRGRSANAVPPGVYKLAEDVEKKIAKLEQRIELISRGIDHDQYRRFVDLTPIVTLSAARTLWIVERRAYDANTHENALFCSSFVTGTLLKLQDAYRPRRRVNTPGAIAPQFRVIQKGVIIVWPGDHNGDEVIREIEPGDVLHSFNERLDKPGYVSVFQDGECAFVAVECVERITFSSADMNV